MNGSLSERSSALMGRARDEAARLHHHYFGTEHILLGISGESEGIAAETLKSFDITHEQVRAGVTSIIGVGPPTASPNEPRVTPRAKQVLRFAKEEADMRGTQVEPEHLLIGVTREVQGVAAEVLRNLQAPPESVGKKVSELLSQGDEGGLNRS